MGKDVGQCDCGYNEDLGEHLLCPEGARLLAERDKAYRRLTLFEDYERAREAYQAHASPKPEEEKRIGPLGGEIILRETGEREFLVNGKWRKITWAGNVETMPWLFLPDDLPDIDPKPEDG